MAQNSDPNDFAAHRTDVTFDVVFTGVRVGVPVSEATANLAVLFKATPAQITGLLDDRSHVVKQGCAQALATVYRDAIEKAGGGCQLVERANPTLIVDTRLFQAPHARDTSSPPSLTPEPPLLAPAPLHVGSPTPEHGHAEPVLFCAKCGTSVSATSAFCATCGNAIAPLINAKPLAAQVAQNARAVNAEAIETFVGKNYEYFQRQWDLSDRTNNNFRWNWAAFFAGIFWLAYRKMYLYATIGAGLAIVTVLGGVYFNSSNALSNASGLTFAAITGLLGNGLYKRHTAIKIKEIYSLTTPERIQVELIRQGGTSISAALAITFGFFLLLVWLDYSSLQ